MTRLPLSTALSIFVAISTMLMVVLIAITLSIRIVPVINASQKTHAEGRVSAISSDIRHFIDNHQQLLLEHSRQPLLVQSIMQPDTHRGRIRDFMQDLTFLGKQYTLSLLDFQGKTIHSTQHTPVFNYSSLDGIKALLNDKKIHHLEISNFKNQYYLRLAQVMIYNQLAEGVLVVEIPLLTMINQMNEQGSLDTLSMKLVWLDQEILHAGKQMSGDIIEHNSPVPGLKLYYRTDSQQAAEELNQLILEITLSILVLSFLIAMVSIGVGKKWFVNPVEQLKKASMALADEHLYKVDTEALHLIELKDLGETFNRMAERIFKREKSLQQRRDELIQLNEELKLSQAQLVHSEKMASLGTLAAGVAHEINNPIGYIKNNLGTLQEYLRVITPLLKEYYRQASEKAENGKPQQLDKISKTLGDEDLGFILQDIGPLLDDSRNGTERVKDIVAGLKSFARIDDANTKIFDLNECVHETLNVVCNELKYNSEVTTDLSELTPIYGNPGQINQVIMNMLVNASHAIDRNGEIHIKTWQQNEQIKLSITDNGCGIQAEHIKNLFAPFFTTKEIGKGTGLGLSISHGIVSDHKGYIQVESQVEVGTTFTITLPVASQQQLSDRRPI